MIELLLHEKNRRLWRCDSLFIVHYHAPISVEDAKADGVFMRAVAQTGRISILVILDATTLGRPDPLVKQELVAQIRELGDSHLGTAQLLRGEGFAFMLFRAMLVTFGMMTRGRERVVSSLEEALKYLGSMPNQSEVVRGLTVAELTAVLDGPAQRAA